ncbi:secretin N-terminal domain-containing protein [uncultured Ilyobacter sp.]|uniref:secretin N-terminal domain-containing protein n=1 Tax=uncultured Ilyobacter sp. TaxID=544433 RepID=UPI0029F4EAB8|nr:secretin N-terminal domain-containing protein [uncultured Ilyobacter sp.]
MRPPAARKVETPEPDEPSREVQATVDEFLGTRQDGEQPLKRERATVQVMPDGKIMLHGPRDEVEEIEDAIDLFSEDLSRGEVIRIFRFRNGDVNAASRILDMMFNDSSRVAALSRQQQLQAAAQAQQRGQRGQRGGEDGEKGGQAGGGLMQQIQQMMGGGGRSGGSSAASKGVRIATDAAHNYLIVKCDEALLPDIIELLRELDIDPAKVDVRVFQLKNIDAGETAENIKAVLGIGKSTQSSSRRQPKRGGNPQQQILEMLQQQMVSVSGGEGSARIEMVEIVSNAITNSLLVSAPPDVMTLIEEVIGKLEGLEGGNITVIKHVPLQNAKVEDVLPLLEEIFGSAGSGANRRGGGSGGRGGGSSPADLGSVTVSGDPRNNTIIFVAQAKDIDTVIEQIQKLDITGAIAEVEMYVCKFGDASRIAEAVSAMHQSTSGSSNRRGPRGGGTSSSSNLDIRITAETATNTILVFAPEEKRDEILEQIEKLDLQNRFDVREIPVVYARPENVADTLLQIFGGAGGSSSSSGRGGRNSRRQVSQTEGRIVVVPDENAKKLLVRAPDEVFVQMQDLVAVLDKPSEQLQIRTFALKHADATVVVESVKGAMAEFMQLQQRLGQGDLDMDAFTAIADTRTNSVVVVGSTETFLFVDQVIQAVDGDTPPDQQKQFRTFVLDRSDASTVAEAINAFASGTSASSGGGRRGGGRGSSAMGTGAILDVQAVAETGTNAVMVYGRPEDIDLVEQMVISELEGALSSHLQFATIPVQHAMPTQLIAYIQPFLDETAGLASDSGRSRKGGSSSSRQGPRLIGNDNARTIIVYGSKQEITEVETLIARFDNKDTMLHQHEIIPVPWGQDAFALADTVQSVVNESEQENADRTGRQARLVTIEADEHSNSIIAFGDPAQLAVVKTVVQQLQSIRPEKPVTRVIELVNLSAEEAEQLIGDMQERRSSGGSSSIRRSSPSRSSGSSRRSSGSSSRRSPTRRGRSSNWNPSHNAPRLSLGPAGFGSPVVGTLCCMPTTVLFLQATDGDQPPQPAAGDAPKSQLPERLQGEIAKLSSISGQLRGDVVATPLDSKRIIVTGDADDVEFIVQMLALMERSTPQPVIQVFELENAKAAAIAPLIDDTLQALIEQRGGGGDRIDSISIIAEARGNTIIASASEPNMEMIAEIISKLDLATGLDTKTELIPLKHVRASEAFDLLEDAIKRLNEMREVPSEAQASIQAIERSNAILVVGTKSDISEIQAMIEGIDVELPPEDDFSTANITIVDLKNTQAEDLAETLTDLIGMEQARSRGGGSSSSDMPLLRKLVMSTADGQELPPINLDKPMVIMPEKAKNSLIIFASESNTQSLLAIVELFDSLPVGAEVEVKSIILHHAAAEEVADLIEEVFDEAKTALKRPSEGDSGGLEQGVMPPVPPGIAARGLPYNLVVSHDTRTNTVIIVGRKDAVLLAAGLVTELDTPSADLNMKSYVIRLQNLQAANIQEKLEDLLDKRLDAIGVSENEARDSAIIEADDRSNSLIVIASPEVHDIIVKLTAELDAAEPYSVVDSEFRRLNYADAAKLAGLLQELFDKKKDADQDVTESGQENVLFVFADARSNALMMAGTRDYLNEANTFIDKLDQAFDPTVQFAVRPVRLNSAANIAQLLRDMIDESRSEQDSQMQGTPIHVAADPYSNNLLLAASAEDMVMLERWIQVLDRPAEPGRVVRIIPLTRGSAQDLAQSAEDLFATSVSGADDDLTITHDEATNSVIAIGPPVVVKDIEQFVNQINQAEGAGAVVRIFKLGQADAADAGELLRSVLEGKAGSVGNGSSSGSSSDELHQVMLYYQREHPEMGVETLKALRTEIVVIDDLRTNSLIITAPPESIPLMESLVAAVDIPPDSANVRVFRLRNSDAEEMVDMLDELFSSDSSVTTQSGQDTQELQLTFGDSAVGGRQQLSFTVDTRTNAVIAAGTDGYLDLVEELIVELDSQPIDDRKVLVYEPGNNDALAIQQAVKEYSDAEQQRLDELQDEISVSRRQEAEIVAIASEDTGRIILGFDPRRESEVMELVHDLDQPPPQVMIQVLIVEVTLDNSLELGVEFAFQDLQYTKAGPTDTNTFDFVGGTDIGAAGSGLGGFTFTITGADFNFLIRTLQNEGNLQVLSRPQIVAMDNQEAYIKVTNDVPYPSGTSVTGTGIVQTSVSRREVGIELTVTPHINPDGYVRLEINQTVSDITSSTVDLGNGLTSPIFLDREAETMVTVKDNETVVLGGLITTSDETREQKIPVVGDIPGLGWLFRNETTDTSRNELLVILTPRVIRSIEDYRELSAQERDRTGYIPPEILSHPLMNQLRVKADQLKVESEDDMLGPFPAEPVQSEDVEEDYDEEVYGPVRSSNASRQIQAERHDAVDPDSYEIPMSCAGGSERWAERTQAR